MKRLSQHLVGIDQGEAVLFSDYENDGDMWSGSGPRQFRLAVRFSDRYLRPPSVMAHLSMWDMAHGTNARADVQAEDVTETGFAILFRTWGDTRVARVRVGWMAIGPVMDENDWDV